MNQRTCVMEQVQKFGGAICVRAIKPGTQAEQKATALVGVREALPAPLSPPLS
jgi:hypothetical protein